MNPDQERVKKLLHDTVLMLCKSGLKYQEQLEIKGVIGITIDKKDVVIVHIKDLHALNGSNSEATQVSSCTAADEAQSTPTKRIKTENLSDYQSYCEATPSVTPSVQTQNKASSVLYFTDDIDNQSGMSTLQSPKADMKVDQWALAIPQPKTQNMNNPTHNYNLNNNNVNAASNNNANFFGNNSMSNNNNSMNYFTNMNQMNKPNVAMQQQQLQQRKPTPNQMMRQPSPMVQTPQKQMALMALTPSKATPQKAQFFQQQQSMPSFEQQQQQSFQPNYQPQQQQQQYMPQTTSSRGRSRGSRGQSSSRGRARGRGRANVIADDMGMMMMGRGGGKISVENKTIDDFSYDKETITHYKCKLCGMSYTSHSGLLTHQVKSHGRQKKAGVGRKPKNQNNDSFDDGGSGFRGGDGDGDGYYEDDYGDYDGEYYQ